MTKGADVHERLRVWAVEIQHSVDGEKPQLIRSKRMSFTRAREVLAAYERRGYKAEIVNLD